MRVIGGEARGRTIRAPRNNSVRPTSDRVREAMFDVLGSLDGVEDRVVLDLFAGSGALGIEAISRGAASVTFVEEDPSVIEVIKANLISTGTGALAPTRVICADVLSYLRTHDDRVNLALVDPPYAFSSWPELLGELKADLVVAESSRPVELPEPYDLHRVYRYSTTLVTVAVWPNEHAPRAS